MSLAISEVEYRIKGLSDSPIPRFSISKQVYLSPFVWPKSRVCRCHAVFMLPSPIIHCCVSVYHVSRITVGNFESCSVERIAGDNNDDRVTVCWSVLIS